MPCSFGLSILFLSVVVHWQKYYIYKKYCSTEISKSFYSQWLMNDPQTSDNTSLFSFDFILFW